MALIEPGPIRSESSNFGFLSRDSGYPCDRGAMDLFSAASRVGRPFRFEADANAAELPIGARGMIGDGSTVALVRVDGAIDWLCLPRFDSPSVFGALLDPTRGGITSITPSHRPFSSLQAYDPGTNVLETLFEVEGQGAVRMVDFMPWSGDPATGALLGNFPQTFSHPA
ncbi:MAG TPA: trehalase-like domain-containing protein [Polyangiaceae bacterium]